MRLIFFSNIFLCYNKWKRLLKNQIFVNPHSYYLRSMTVDVFLKVHNDIEYGMETCKNIHLKLTDRDGRENQKETEGIERKEFRKLDLMMTFVYQRR